MCRLGLRQACLCFSQGRTVLPTKNCVLCVWKTIIPWLTQLRTVWASLPIRHHHQTPPSALHRIHLTSQNARDRRQPAPNLTAESFAHHAATLVVMIVGFRCWRPFARESQCFLQVASGLAGFHCLSSPSREVVSAAPWSAVDGGNLESPSGAQATIRFGFVAFRLATGDAVCRRDFVVVWCCRFLS